MMRLTFQCFAILTLASCDQIDKKPGAAAPEPAGRYQMERIGTEGTQIYVLDTKDGTLRYCTTPLAQNQVICGEKTDAK